MGMMRRERINAKAGVLLLLLLCALLLTGCRTRLDSGRTQPADSGAAREEAGTLPGEALPGDPETAEDGAPSDRTRENPEAALKEYDEAAPAEILPGTEHPVHGAGEGSGAPLENPEAGRRVSRLNEEAEQTALQTVAAEEAEQRGTAEDAPEADSAGTYYTVLLQDRLKSLFECKRPDLYWETPRDYVTVYRTSPEHSLILEAGAYDVSARLLPENLRVDDGWVVRKNPGVIVKLVEGDVLGARAVTAAAAESAYRRLTGRPGWSGIDAVRSRRVLLLSAEMLEAPHLRTAALLLIAKTANPALFADVDPEQALRMLTEEATGTLPVGIWFYTGTEAAGEGET